MSATGLAAAAASSSPMPAPKTDGRNLRSEKTKTKIIFTALAIVAEGQELTMVATARWADVSIRSVFKHYRKLKELHLAVRTEILMEFVERLSSIKIDGGTREARSLCALSHLQSIFVRTSHEVRQLEWAFRGHPDPYLDSTEAEVVRFNIELQSLVDTILGKEVYELLGKSQPGRYAELKFILETQLSPWVLVPLLCSASLVGAHHMIVGTINEFVLAAKPT